MTCNQCEVINYAAEKVKRLMKCPRFNHEISERQSPVHFWAAPRPPTSRVGPRRSHHVPAQVPSTSPRAAGKWLSIPHPIPEGAPAQLELLRAHSHPDPHVLTERFSFVESLARGTPVSEPYRTHIYVRTSQLTLQYCVMQKYEFI